MYTVAVVIGSLIAGVLFGAVPALVGYKKGRTGLAIAGFFSCVVGSFILGMFLSVPACIIFTVIILALGKKEPINNTYVNTPPPYTSNLKKCPQCGNLINSDAAFCTKCGAQQFVQASSLQCPTCGNTVEPGTVFCNKCGTKVR